MPKRTTAAAATRVRLTMKPPLADDERRIVAASWQVPNRAIATDTGATRRRDASSIRKTIALTFAAVAIFVVVDTGSASARARDPSIVVQLRARGVRLHQVSSRGRVPFGVPTRVYTAPGGELR